MSRVAEPPARIAVLDYGIGNLRSAEKAFQHLGADATLTADPEVIAAADGVVLPGVGAFGPCREALRRAGLDGPTLEAVASGRPFLGICVGMQLLYDGSEESPGVAGLGEDPWVYFVHSYAAEATSDVIATCDYGGPVTAAVQREQVFATQFHPEKSGATGLAVLGNFVRLAAGARSVADRGRS